MEAQQPYIVPNTRYIAVPESELYCERCNSYLGHEIEIKWYKANREKWVSSKTFLRIDRGATLAKLHVRGEVICRCGWKVVWDG